VSEESLKANVARLQEYKKRLILFPRRNGKTTKGDASAADVKTAKKGEKVALSIGSVLPIKNEIVVKEGPIGDFEGEENAYRKLRLARSDARLIGVREKRAKLKAEEAQAAKK
jgi:large subunit ribosomal protein L13e